MVYAEDLKSLTLRGLWVRVPLPAQIERSENWDGKNGAFAPFASDSKDFAGDPSADGVAKSGDRLTSKFIWQWRKSL